MRFVPRSAALAALALVFFLVGVSVRDASACGGFFARRPATEAELAKTLPYLTVEQVLVVWDEDTGVQDFVREARFDRTNQSFGFVVPLPSKPEVFPVKKAPFDALRTEFPFDPPSDLRVGSGGGVVQGGGKGGGAPPVVVLSEQRIGSFTAFVLMANDRAGFDKWLDDNGFATTPQSSAWLAEYVKLGFFFVAFRYEPSKAKGDAGAGESGMTSETVRIRFKTPLPYYPYREPEHAPGTATPDRRMLSAWLVTKKPMLGVVQKRSTKTFMRPWSEGMTKTPTREVLAAAMGELGALLPQGAASFHVATYRDLKTSREGYGDALFVPSTPVALTAAQIEERRRLLPVLDWRLGEDVDAGLDETPPAPTPSASAPPSPSASAAPTARSGGCSVSVPVPASSWAALAGFALVLAVARRSRRRHAALVVVLAFGFLAACRKPAAEVVDAGDAGDAGEGGVAAAPERRPRTKADLEKDALAILEGKVDGVTILGTEQPGGGFGLTGLGSLGAPRLRGKTTVSGKTAKPVTDFDRVLAGLRSRYRLCYETALNRDPDLAGKVIVALKIGPTGEVEDAKVEKTEKLNPSVASCAANVTKRATFASPGDTGTTGTVELVFQPDR